MVSLMIWRTSEENLYILIIMISPNIFLIFDPAECNYYLYTALFYHFQMYDPLDTLFVSFLIESHLEYCSTVPSY